MRLDENILTGTLPTEVGLLTNLWEMWLNNNDLTGSLPTELGLLTRMIDEGFGTPFNVENNEGLCGLVPTLAETTPISTVGTSLGNPCTTSDPTSAPSAAPTVAPTASPTASPSGAPTASTTADYDYDSDEFPLRHLHKRIREIKNETKEVSKAYSDRKVDTFRHHHAHDERPHQH